jgi:hypothetical protein
MNMNQFLIVKDSITYKPKHWLKHEEVAPGIVSVYWTFERPDCYNPSEWGVGRSGEQIIELAKHDKESLVKTIFGMTMRLEEHECREFFLYASERPFDPHKKLLNETH